MTRAFILLTSLLLFTACNHRSDAEAGKKLPGVWHFIPASASKSGGDISFTIAPNGEFSASVTNTGPTGAAGGVSVIAGTFQVRDWYLVQTITNSSENLGHLPIVARYKIRSISDREMQVDADGKQATFKKDIH